MTPAAADGRPRPSTARRSVGLPAAGLAVLFTAQAAAHLITLPRPAGAWLGAFTASSALVTGLLAVGSARGRPIARHAPRVLWGLTMANGVGLAAVGNGAGTEVPLMAVLVAVGALVTDWRWVVRWLSVGFAGGVLGQLAGAGPPEPGPVAGLVGATMVSAFLFVARDLSSTRLQARLDALNASQAALAGSEQRYRELFDLSPVGIGLTDEAGLLRQVNGALCTIVGREPADLLGRSPSTYAHPDDVLLTARSLVVAGAPTSGWLRKRIVRPDGEVRWIRLDAATVPAADGGVWTLAHMQDVTDEVKAAGALQRLQTDQSAIAAVVRQLNSDEDVRSAIVGAARTVAEASLAVLLVPAGPEELVATACAGAIDLRGLRVPLRTGNATSHVWRTGERLFIADPVGHPMLSAALLALGGSRSLMLEPVRAREKLVGILAVGWSQRVDGLDHHAAQAVQVLATEAGVALERESLIASLATMARTDALTGLANRRSWDDGLAAAMDAARQTGSALTVAILDVDYFKAYNDELGHEAGDALLRDFATAARAAVRSHDLLARWGGEEFTLLLTRCASEEEARVAVDRVRRCMPPGATSSAGYATWDRVENARQLMKRADDGLYLAKGAGRDRSVAATPANVS